MSSQEFICGKCCAGDFCFNEHCQLCPDYKCTTCGKILHLLCGIGGQEEDTFICRLCFNQSQTVNQASRSNEHEKGSPESEAKRQQQNKGKAKKQCKILSEEKKKEKREKTVFAWLKNVKLNL